MINSRKTSTICTLIAALALNSCATISGAATGPIGATVETHKKYQENLKKNNQPLVLGIAILSYPIIQSLSIAGSVPMGLFDGLAADIYFIKKGKYPTDYRPWRLGSGEEALEKLRTENEKYSK